MKELNIMFVAIWDVKNILQSFPNLEILRAIDVPTTTYATSSTSSYLTQNLNSGACHTLTTLELGVNDKLVKVFAAMLKSRSGLQSLDIHVQSIGSDLVNAINQHASSLRSLTLRSGRWTFRYNLPYMPNLQRIQRTCGMLKYVELHGLDFKASDFLADRHHWKNPDALESLTLQGDSIILKEEQIDFEGGSSTGADLTSVEYIDGWKIPQRNQYRRTHNRASLKVLFKAAQGYSRLRMIRINGVRYDKVQSGASL